MVIKWSILALIVAAVIFLLAWAVFRYRSRETETGIEEFHESLWSWMGFKTDVRLFFRTLLHQFESKRPPAHGRSRSYDDDDSQDLRDMREIYRRLLWEASEAGIARHYWETPYEYVRRLQTAVPEGSAPLAELTELYVAVRYGAIQTEETVMKHANGLWKTLRQLLVALGSGEALTPGFDKQKGL